jgi:hypothetical protein
LPRDRFRVAGVWKRSRIGVRCALCAVRPETVRVALQFFQRLISGDFFDVYLGDLGKLFYFFFT